MKGLSGVKQLALGYQFSCGLVSSGDDATPDSVYCWGSNRSGQMGRDAANNDQAFPVPEPVVDSTGLVDPVSVSAGDAHACAATADGNAYCWGRGSNGQLGNGQGSNDSNLPVQVDPDKLGSDPLGADPAARSVVQVAAGGNFTCVLTAGDGVWCWGANDSGQLGRSAGQDMVSPLRVAGLGEVKQLAAGESHVCALLTDNRVKCWGNNEYGQLGLGPYAATSVAVPTFVGNNDGIHSPGQVEEISVGGNHSCAYATNGQISCWGENSNGQIGNGQPISEGAVVRYPSLVSFVQLPPPPPVVVEAPSGWIGSKSAVVRFRSKQGPTCFVDGVEVVAPKRCESPFSLSNLKDGRHFMVIRHEGNGRSSSRRIDWSVDTTAPKVVNTFIGLCQRTSLSSKTCTYDLATVGVRDSSGVVAFEYTTSTSPSSNTAPTSKCVIAQRCTVAVTGKSISVPTSAKRIRFIDRVGNYGDGTKAGWAKLPTVS